MLPSLASRYAQHAIDGALPIRTVKIEQRGEMTLKPGAAPRHFLATETLAAEEVAFSWKARLEMLGPFAIHVTDFYDGTNGGLDVRVLGLPVQRKRGPAMAEGEVLRYLAEIPWVPHAIIANPQLQWRELDERRVEVATGVVAKRVAVQLTFDENGHIIEARAQRPRMEAANTTTPWIGSYGDYRKVSGVLIPTRGEVGWELSTGLFTYWRGEITSLEVIGSSSAGVG
jgi:hypothetical protein